MAYIGQTPTAVPLVAGDFADGSISEAKLGPDAVSLAKMKAGTDGNIISYDASGNPVAIATGSNGQVLTSAGAGQPCAFEALPAGGYTSLSTVAFSSGTSATVSGFPSTATRIIIGIDGMSSVGSTDWAVKLGDSGGIETSGYTGEYNGVLSWVNNVNSDPTSQFDIFQNAPTIAGFWGTIDMLLVDATANKWQVMIWVLGDARATFCYGMKSLTSTLTQVEISNASANDAGAINAAYI